MEFRIERIFKGPGFAETLYLGTCAGQRIIRKASNPGALHFSRIALVREIRLLMSLREELKPFFPALLRTNLGDLTEDSPGLPTVIFYDMPYYPPEEGWETMSVLLCEGALTRKAARRIIGEIIDTAFMYFRLDDCEPQADYAEKTMLRAIRESLTWASNEENFRQLFSLNGLRLNRRTVRNIPALTEYFEDTPLMRKLLIPARDRFLHGDFFPENILCNTKTGRWILLDPVSVRGVHRGDFMLDLNKMEGWLTGELPALRTGQFTLDITGNSMEFVIGNRSGKLENLHRLGLDGWYADLLREPRYADVFTQEKGWNVRSPFINAFYALCMLPLADKRQAAARYAFGIRCMDEFIGNLEDGL
ncbi:hypothetical protein LLG96_18710 [bacterium]|nr:hypothetical protein [bacterium]